MNISLIPDDFIKHSDGTGKILLDARCAGPFEVNIEDFCECLNTFNVCCGVFRDNYRKGDNLISIDCLQFDFDDGTSPHLIQIPYNHIIAASTNHLKDKNDGKGIIPRFHLFILLKEPITRKDDYSRSCRYLRRHYQWNNDSSCTDCTRYFKKHQQILRKSMSLQPVTSNDILQWRQEMDFLQARQDMIEKKKQELYRQQYGKLPDLDQLEKTEYVQSIIGGLSIHGEWYPSMRKLVAFLKRKQIEKDAIVSFILSHTHLKAGNLSLAKKQTLHFYDWIH